MKTGSLIVGGILLLVGGFVLSLFALKLGWAWIVPDIFPQAVQQGLVVNELTWEQAIKLAIFLSILSWWFKGSSGKSK